MVVFEDWIEKPFSKANQEPESAINLAELYWQGLDPDLIKKLRVFKKIKYGFISSKEQPLNFRTHPLAARV